MTDFDPGELLEAIPDAVVVADTEARIAYANRAVERLLGYAPEALVGRSLHVIQPERLHQAHDAGFGRWARTGSRALFGSPIRLPARHADGHEVEIDLNLAEIRGPGSTRLVVGVLRDLGERVELERRLEVLPLLRATTTAATRLWTRLDPELVLRTLTDVLVSDFDAALARAWVYEPEADELRMVASAGLSTRVHDSPRYRIDVATHPLKIGVVARERRPFIANVLEGDPQFDQEWVAREKLQSVAVLPLAVGDRLLGVMVSFSRRPLSDEAAETIGHLAALAAAALGDAELVAREREARDEADQARRHFELVAAVSAELAASLEPDVTVQRLADALVPAWADWCVVDLMADDRSLTTVGAAHRDPALVDEIHRLRERYPPRERLDPPHAIYRAINSGTTLCETVSDAELRGRAVNAEHLELLRRLGIGSHVVAVLEARGRVIGAISLVRGPDRDPFDAADASTAAEIGRRAALATDNAMLFRAAGEAVALRDRFLAVASHELRTPLSVVQGHWELLGRRLAATRREHALSDEALRKVDDSMRRLGQGIEQLNLLTGELLDVSRLTRGAMELRLGPVDLLDLVRHSVEDVGDEPRGGRIRTALPDEPVVGTWDARRLRQVVDNLLLNAMKYSPPPAPIEVLVRVQGSRVHLSVSDEGIGIPPSELESIFEPFVRAHNASDQHYPGMGLGLAVSREIVERLGGRMWAESEGVGRGSTFVVELDLSSAAAGRPSGED